MATQENTSQPIDPPPPVSTQASLPTIFDERLKKAFDFGADSTKQLITVAVGVIAFTITFSKDFVGATNTVAKVLACLAWIFYLLSVLCGLATLNGLTGQLEPGDDAPLKPSIWASAVNKPMMGQWIFFMLGLLCIFIFGIVSIFNRDQAAPEYNFTFPNSTIHINPSDTAQQQAGTDTGAKVMKPQKTIRDTPEKNIPAIPPVVKRNNHEQNKKESEQTTVTSASGDLVFLFNYGKGKVRYLIPAKDTQIFRERKASYDLQQQQTLDEFVQFLEKYRSK